jgi:hypothetical protein
VPWLAAEETFVEAESEGERCARFFECDRLRCSFDRVTMSLQEVWLGKMMVACSTESGTGRVGDDGGLFCG